LQPLVIGAFGLAKKANSMIEVWEKNFGTHMQAVQISRLSIRFFKNLLDKTSHKN